MSKDRRDTLRTEIPWVTDPRAMGNGCLTICLYGGTEEVLDLTSEAYRLFRLMERIGLPISHIGLGGPASSGKLVGKQAGLSRLDKATKGSYDSLSLLTCPKGSDAPAFDWAIHLNVTQEPKARRTRSITCEQAYSERLSDKNFIEELLNGEGFDYGFSLVMPKEEGPEGYVLIGPAESEPDLWQDFRMSERPLGDRIRDIYPVNYLNERHLALPVGSRTFKDLLLAYGATSTRQIAGLAEYVLPMHSIGPVREIMRPTGQVICLAP